MRNWGVGLIICGALAVFGFIADPKAGDTQEGMVGAVIFLAGGGLLAYKGQKYIDSMRDTLSNIMEINKSQISVKATTTEGLGFVGREEGVAAHCVCILKQ